MLPLRESKYYLDEGKRKGDSERERREKRKNVILYWVLDWPTKFKQNLWLVFHVLLFRYMFSVTVATRQTLTLWGFAKRGIKILNEEEN